MSRYAYVMPKVEIERAFRIGPGLFRPHDEYVNAARATLSRISDERRRVRSLDMFEMANDWDGSATVEFEGDTADNDFHEMAKEVVTVFRYFHRLGALMNRGTAGVGLAGETPLAVQTAVAVSERGVEISGRRISGPIATSVTDTSITEWEADPIFGWLSAQLMMDRDQRSIFGSKALTAIALLDASLLANSRELTALYSAIAVEVLLSLPRDALGQETEKGTKTVAVARRALYLTDGQTCTAVGGCPYLASELTSMTKVLTHREELLDIHGNQGCSSFFDIIRPAHAPGTALFSARNDVAHEGRSSVAPHELSKLNQLAERIVRAGVAWFAANPNKTIEDLDAEIVE